MKRKFGTIIEIGDILVSEEVVTDFFACDYPVCKGACCIIGDSGAPLAEEELPALERDYPLFKDLMSEDGRNAVNAKGYFEIDRDGDIVTPLAKGEECAFCHFGPQGECMCAIECRGLVKPRSCSLYPIRVSRLSSGSIALNMHHWDICKDAYEKGRREGIRAYEFLKKPLTEAFGEEFYEALSQAAGHVLSSLER